MKEKAFFIIFKGLKIAKNCVRHKGAPLAIIVWTIKRVDFLKVRQTLSNIFAMHYGDIEDLNMVFLFLFFIISD